MTKRFELPFKWTERVGENELRVGLFCCAIEQFLTPVLAG